MTGLNPEGLGRSRAFGSINTNDGAIDGDPILGGPASGSSTGVSLGGGWTTVDSNQPVLVILELFVNTDGTTDGSIVVQVDESGGTTADYTLEIRADSDAGSGHVIIDNPLLYLPAGAQINLVNDSDPNNNNALDDDRKYVVSS